MRNPSEDKNGGDSAALVRDLRHGSWTAQVEEMLRRAADRIEELERQCARFELAACCPDERACEKASASSSCTESIPEGCTPTDAKVLREGNFQLATESQRLREALRFYANRQHWTCDGKARILWDTVSGEPTNWHWRENENEDAEGIEDGTIAGMALRGEPVNWDGESPPLIEGEPEWHIEQAAKASALPESGRTVDKSGEYDADVFDSGRDSMADDVLDILNVYRDQFNEDERIKKVRALCREQLVSAPHKDQPEGK